MRKSSEQIVNTNWNRRNSFNLNIVLSITASLGNVLNVIALHRETSLRPPTKLLLWRSLIFVSELWLHLSSSIVPGLNYLLVSQVSIYTATAIGVYRLLTLGYTQLVTLPRVCAVVVFFWLIGMSLESIVVFSYSGYCSLCPRNSFWKKEIRG